MAEVRDFVDVPVEPELALQAVLASATVLSYSLVESFDHGVTLYADVWKLNDNNITLHVSVSPVDGGSRVDVIGRKRHSMKLLPKRMIAKRVTALIGQVQAMSSALVRGEEIPVEGPPPNPPPGA